MATKLADAYVQIIPSAKGIQGSISNVLNGEAESAGASAGAGIASKLKGAIATAGIGAAVVQAVKASIDAGGALQQSFGGLETIYGDAAEEAKQYAYEAAKAGISANDYAEQAVSFGASLKQAFAGDTTKAVKAANTAIMDMTDNAAKMGTPIENIQNAYQGFAKQNYTMLDNLKLGYGGTKTEMERLLADAQKISGVEYNIDNLGDVYDAIHVIQGELGLTGVAADEAATTFTGSFGSMKANLTNLLGNMSLGEDVKPSLMALLGSTQTFITGNFLPMIRNILGSLPDIFTTVFSWAADAITSINWIETGQNLITNIKTGIANLQTDIPQAMDDIGNAAKEWFESVDWKQTGQDIIGLLSDGITILTDDIPQLIKDIGLKAIEWIGSVNWLETGTAIINFIGDGIETVVDSIPGAIQSIGNTAKAWFEAIEWSKVGETVIGLLKAGIQKLVIDIPLAIMNIAWEAIKWFKGVLWEVSGGDIIGFIVNGITNFALSIPEKLQEIAKNAIAYFKNQTWVATGMAIITQIKNGIISFVLNIPNKLEEIAKDAIEKFKNQTWVATGMAIITAIKNGIIDFVTRIPDKLKEIAKSGIEAIKNSSWLASGHAIITRTVKGIKEFFTKIPDKLMEIIKDAIAKITDPETWLQVGKDIVNGIVDGIKSIPGAIGGALTGAVKSAKDAVCGFLDINSPSKLFRDDVGSPIAEGIITGFDRGIKGLSGDMISSINDAKEAAADSMRVSAGYTISGRSHQMDAMPATIAGAVLDGVKQIADGVERGIGSMKMVANNRETARFVADLGFARA